MLFADEYTKGDDNRRRTLGGDWEGLTDGGRLTMDDKRLAASNQQPTATSLTIAL